MAVTPYLEIDLKSYVIHNKVSIILTFAYVTLLMPTPLLNQILGWFLCVKRNFPALSLLVSPILSFGRLGSSLKLSTEVSATLPILKNHLST